jgi:hypothetical protein
LNFHSKLLLFNDPYYRVLVNVFLVSYPIVGGATWEAYKEKKAKKERRAVSII